MSDFLCEKIKLRTGPMWRDEIAHHLYHVDPLASLSVDTLGPLSEDDDGFFIVVIVDNFSKFVGLYPARSTMPKDFIGALMQWVGIFGVPKKIRSDGGSQFTSKLSENLSALLGYKHLVVVPCRSQANALAERRTINVMNQLRALVFEKWIKENWTTIFHWRSVLSTIQWMD